MSDDMTERLPRTINDKVKYQLVLRAFEGEWIAGYEFGPSVLGEVYGHGATIEAAIEDLRSSFEFDYKFKYYRHLLTDYPFETIKS